MTIFGSDPLPLCVCACHPSPAKDIHAGQVCPCQQTPGEKAALWAELQDSLQEWHSSPAFQALQEGELRADEEASLWASSHAMVFTHSSRLVPHVLEGTLEVDGETLGFYFRERHGSWDVRTPDDQGETVASGREEEYSSTLDILRLVRTHLTRWARSQGCSHSGLDPTWHYCPHCGEDLEA